MNLLRTIIAILLPAPKPRQVSERKAQMFRVCVSCLRRDIAEIDSTDHLFAFEEEIRWLCGHYKGLVNDKELVESTDELEVLLKAKASEIGGLHLLESIAV